MFEALEEQVLETAVATMDAVPVDEEFAQKLYIRQKLEESLAYAAMPNAKRYTWDEFRCIVKERYGL
jgi:hypothetical protein